MALLKKDHINCRKPRCFRAVALINDAVILLGTRVGVSGTLLMLLTFHLS